MDNTAASFGRWAAQQRTSWELTPEELAPRLKLTPAAIVALEQGAHPHPEVWVAFAYATFFHFHIADLIAAIGGPELPLLAEVDEPLDLEPGQLCLDQALALPAAPQPTGRRDEGYTIDVDRVTQAYRRGEVITVVEAGAYYRWRREALRLSVADVAAATGLCQRQLRSYEAGKLRDISLPRLLALEASVNSRGVFTGMCWRAIALGVQRPYAALAPHWDSYMAGDRSIELQRHAT